MFDYFYGQSGEMFSYFRVPKILFRDIRFKDLSTDAKTLYGILLDRMGLSAKNGWLDGQGRVYIIFPILSEQDEPRLCVWFSGEVMLSQRKLRLSQSPIKKAVWGKAPPVKIWASVWRWRARKSCWWTLTHRGL